MIKNYLVKYKMSESGEEFSCVVTEKESQMDAYLEAVEKIIPKEKNGEKPYAAYVFGWIRPKGKIEQYNRNSYKNPYYKTPQVYYIW